MELVQRLPVLRARPELSQLLARLRARRRPLELLFLELGQSLPALRVRPELSQLLAHRHAGNY
jgi:hypothetical protein